MRPIYFCVVFLAACASRPTPVAPVAAATPEAAVYAALLDSLHPRFPDTLLLGDSTLTFRAPRGGVAAWQTQFDSIPASLPSALEALSATRRSSATLPLPRPISAVTNAMWREMFASGIRAGWDEFHRRYPRQRSFIRLSPVVISPDGLDALVYYEYHCEALCGAGEAVWLTRRARADWHVRKIIRFWIS